MAIPGIPDWREQILMGVGARPTSENLRFFDAWQRSEGGNASNNPFNTTQVMGGVSRKYNDLGGGIGVQNYLTPQMGVDATINTLTNGRYGNIIGALRRGDNAMAAAQALANSPWGTGALTMKVLGGATNFQTVTGGVDTTGATPAGTGTLPTGAPGTSGYHDLASLAQSAYTPGQEQQPQQQNPVASLREMFSNINQQSVISPSAVALLANLGDATSAVMKARRDDDAMLYGYNPVNQPVTRTLSTLQTGSTDEKYKTLDLGVDFDGQIHPNAVPVVDLAKQYLGTPYLYGGADPRKGFDCSGFVQYLYSKSGVALGRTTRDQAKQGEAVQSVKDLLPGDAVFFDTEGGKGPTHEGIYIGGGQFIHAPHTGDVVKISNLSDPYYASRFLTGRRFMTEPGQPPQGGYSPVPQTQGATGGKLPGLAEAFYDPLGSYDTNGGTKGTFGGPIGGHSDHVHISAYSPQEMLKAINVAQQMGLHVGENPYVGDNPEAGIHVNTSYHYRTFPGVFGGRKLGEAIDVSGDPDLMAKFYRTMTGT
jgi:cell wall-associated NlpC family hydrolase